MQSLRGVYVVMVTPFTEDGEVDHAGIRTNVDWWIEQGVHGLIPLGSTGEFASLSPAQKSRVLQTTVETARGRVPIVAGAASETTEGAIANAREAERAGAAGVLVLPPWYYTPTQEELVVHFRKVSQAIGIPVMLYNNPSSSKVDILPETVARLAEVPGIRYIKESSGDIKRITAIRMLTEDRLTVFCGWEDMAYESFLLGAQGWVCVIGNVAPRQAVELFERAVDRGDHAGAWALYRRMLPLLRLLEYAGRTQKIVKHALDGMGLCGGFSSSPKLPLEPEWKEQVERALRELGPGDRHV
jgi:4-hydroxy-tetrahydrodipicolinate synthase